MPDDVDLDAIETCADFGRALTAVRERAGMSVREVARAVGVPASTVGGYFGGAHLPGLRPANLVENMLRSCQVRDPEELRRWVDTWQRLRRLRRAGSDAGPPDPPGQPRQPGPPGAVDPPVGAVPREDRSRTLTIRPPIGRLGHIPVIRGRDELLRSLVAELPRAGGTSEDGRSGEDKHARVHVLHGLGGVGKSTVALALAAAALDRRVRTWWIGATGVGAVPTGMAALAVELGATDHQLRSGSLPDLVWRLLDATGQPWLLIIDNADDPPGDLALPTGDVLDGTGWLRPVTRPLGMVVITTRSGADWGEPPPGAGADGTRADGTRADGSAPPRPAWTAPWLRRYQVAPLGPRDAGRALQDLAGDAPGPLAAAVSLGTRLGGLPLAISLAGQYLAEARRMPATLAGVPVAGPPGSDHPGTGGHGGGVARTFADYERELADGGHHRLLAGFGGPAGAGRRPERELVGPTWELSLDLLAARGLARTRPLLTLLASLGPAPIPFGLLLSADVLAMSPLFPDLTAAGLWEALRALTGHGLIEHTRDTAADRAVADQIVLHPLVRDSFARAARESGQLEDYLDVLTRMLVAATAELDPRDPERWPHWQALAGHATSGLELIQGVRGLTEARLPPGLLTPATLAARYLRAVGRLAEADAAYSSAWETGRVLLGHDHADVLALAHDLYRVRAARGRRADAEQGLRAVLDDRIRVLGSDHPDTLTTQHYLGRTLRDQGRHGEAQAWLRRTLAGRERVLGSRHRDTLTSRNNVGDLLSAQGAWPEAEALLCSVRSDRMELLGPEHPATLVTSFLLTRLYRDRGEDDRAEEAGAELVAACRRVLGPDHPRTLAGVGLLSEIRWESGRAGLAAADLADATRRSDRVLGPDHDVTVRMRRLLDRLPDRDADAGDAEE